MKFGPQKCVPAELAALLVYDAKCQKIYLLYKVIKVSDRQHAVSNVLQGRNNNSDSYTAKHMTNHILFSPLSSLSTLPHPSRLSVDIILPHIHDYPPDVTDLYRFLEESSLYTHSGNNST